MFSRFFSNIHFRRVLCCLLALLTFGCCLSPALVQPAAAVAIADDVLIASLALLATSWAGVTFATNGGANTAISNLFQSKPAVKLSLAGLITKKLVVEGTKLLLTRDVRDVFETVLPEIKSFFQTESETVVSVGGGSLVGPVVVGAIYSNFPSVPSDRVWDSSNCVFPVAPGLRYDLVVNFSTGYTSTYSCVFDSACSGIFVDSTNGSLASFSSGTSSFGLIFRSDVKPGGSNFTIPFSKGGSNCSVGGWYKVDSATLSLVSASDSIPFQTSKEVDGTSALEILKPAPLYVVNPDGNEGGDGSSKPEINFKYGMLALEGLIGAITLGGQEAQKDKDPGLKPDEMVNDLQQAMNSAGQNPNPNPNPDPQPNPEPEPAPDPDTPGGEGTPPQFNQMVIPNLKDFFPFCIPGDIKKMIEALCAAPEAPKFTFATSFMGQVYSVNIDLSAWDGVAASVRYMVVAVYIAALAVATRKFIKW